MSLHEYAKNVRSLIRNSPLRILLEQKQELPIVGYEQEISRIKNDIDVLTDRIAGPLNIVIMGEVKAGKSTLMNALIGEKISPANVTETTATIIDICHNEQSQGFIHWHTGEPFSGTVDDAIGMLNDNHGNKSFFDNCAYVKLEVPLENLKKLHIIDTPGLESITEEHALRTKQFAQNADVILWVLNANHLGQEDVEESLASIAKLGKPVFLIINRIDEVEGASDRLAEFVRRRLGPYSDKIFTFSAALALAGVMENDPQKFKESGYDHLLTQLEEIEHNREDVHKESITSSLQTAVNYDLKLHETYQDDLNFRFKEIDKHSREIEYQRSLINDKIESFIHSWMYNHFLVEEEQHLLKLVDDMQILSSKSAPKNIENQLNKYFSDDYLRSILSPLFLEIENQYIKEWQNSIANIKEKISQDFDKFSISKQYEIDSFFYAPVASGQELLLSGAGQGALIAGACGATMAAYSAAIGPYAASITLGSALGAFLPPILLMGVAAGAVAKLISFKSKKGKYNAEVKRQVKDVRDQLHDLLLKEIKSQLMERNQKITDDLNDSFVNILFPNWTYANLEKFLKDINAYCLEIRKSASLN